MATTQQNGYFTKGSERDFQDTLSFIGHNLIGKTDAKYNWQVTAREVQDNIRERAFMLAQFEANV